MLVVDGWVVVMICYFGLVDELFVVEVEEVLEQFFVNFGEVQYFGVFFGVGYIVWYCVCDGKLICGFIYVGQGDGFFDNFGEIMLEEIELGFGDFIGCDLEEMQDLILAEDDYLCVVEFWSFNFDQLEDCEDLEKSMGLLGYFVSK